MASFVEGTNLDDSQDVPNDFEPGACKDPAIFSVDEESDEEAVGEEEDLAPRSSSKGTISQIVDDPAISEFVPEHTSDIEDSGETEENERENIIDNPDWKAQKKHIFILSEAGKPIYSRHGNEEALVTAMGVMQVITSCFHDRGDQIRYMRAGRHRFAILIRQPIILVGVTTHPIAFAQLQTQLSYLYNHILFVLTSTQLRGIFEKRNNYDLRRLLGGSERLFDSLCDVMDDDPSLMLGAVRTLPLVTSVRDNATQSIVQSCNKMKGLVFALLMAGSQLVTMARLKKYQLHPIDMHLLTNLVQNSESFKVGESWTPVCLPKFDSSGFLHGYVSYLDEDNLVYLILLTIDRDQFFDLQQCRTKIVERLEKQDTLVAISESVKQKGYSVKEAGIFELRHFLYKTRSSAQLTAPRMEGLYTLEDARKRVLAIYHKLQYRMHNPGRPLRYMYSAGDFETAFGWNMSGFELYAIFEPLITKEMAQAAMNKLVHWIKREEERLFFMSNAAF